MDRVRAGVTRWLAGRGSGLLALVCVVVGGCGGGGDPQVRSKSFDAPRFSAQPGLVRGSSAASAGRTASYVPKGRILADSNFRPWENGFAFENYGNDADPQNMTPAQVEDLFGTQVCLSGTGETCTLLPPAQRWMENENAAMAGGHCMGFSVTALRMFRRSLKAASFGAPRTPQLAIQDNTALQRTIAGTWVYQDLPLVRKGTVEGTPNELLDKLQAQLSDDQESWTLGIFNRTGGHAITPFAVEDAGGDKRNLLVYDNNFPGVIRAVEFDTHANSWIYHGGPNPDDLGQVYEGDAANPQMILVPTSPGLEPQPCPFCTTTPAGGRSQEEGYGSTLATSEQYKEITLIGSPANHAHLLLMDADGRETGFKDGKIVNHIPGAEVDRPLTVQNWRTAPEPSYRIPVGTLVRVTIDGTGLARKAKHTLSLVGPGQDFEVSELVLRPGQKDHVTFFAGGDGLNYETKARVGSAPLIEAGLVVGSGRTRKAFEFIVTPFGIEGATSLALKLQPQDGLVAVDTAGTTGGLGHSGRGTYVISMARRTADGRTASWVTPDAGIPLEGGEKGQAALVPYLEDYGKSDRIPITIVGPGKQRRLALLEPFGG